VTSFDTNDRVAPAGVADPAACLGATPLLDADHPDVRAFAAAAIGDEADAVTRAVRLYYAVRDGLRYDPYGLDFTPDGFRASAVLARRRGFCVTKAGVLAAVARSAGIPARLGFADVRNHLATERLRQLMGTDVFYYHGYTELWLEGAWRKATPAFNRELCERFRVKALDFDGRTDSIFQPYDADGRRHMEYLNDRGTRADMPLDEIREAMQRLYPGLGGTAASGDFDAEAAAER
jgi:transglutaminase-like putative cysteine protease